MTSKSEASGRCDALFTPQPMLRFVSEYMSAQTEGEAETVLLVRLRNIALYPDVHRFTE